MSLANPTPWNMMKFKKSVDTPQGANEFPLKNKSQKDCFNSKNLVLITRALKIHALNKHNI